MAKRKRGKSREAAILGREGGKARARNLSKKRLREIARLGGLARHGKRTMPSSS